MNNLTIEEPYMITYSNLIEFEGRRLSFRKKELFDLTFQPKWIKRSEQGWWIGKKLLSQEKAKELYKIVELKVDVSSLQWYAQIQLDEVFNLNQL